MNFTSLRIYPALCYCRTTLGWSMARWVDIQQHIQDAIEKGPLVELIPHAKHIANFCTWSMTDHREWWHDLHAETFDHTSYFWASQSPPPEPVSKSKPVPVYFEDWK